LLRRDDRRSNKSRRKCWNGVSGRDNKSSAGALFALVDVHDVKQRAVMDARSKEKRKRIIPAVQRKVYLFVVCLSAIAA
jgi:hypothetical protein